MTAKSLLLRDADIGERVFLTRPSVGQSGCYVVMAKTSDSSYVLVREYGTDLHLKIPGDTEIRILASTNDAKSPEVGESDYLCELRRPIVMVEWVTVSMDRERTWKERKALRDHVVQTEVRPRITLQTDPMCEACKGLGLVGKEQDVCPCVKQRLIEAGNTLPAKNGRA